MFPTISRLGFFKKLFGEANVKNVVTLFHDPASASSVRVLNMLKQVQSNASTTTTIDQASSNEAQAKAEHQDFEFDVEEGAPTTDQVRTIVEYSGPGNEGKVVQGANSEDDALEKFKLSDRSFIKPVLVDWYGGKAVSGDNKSEILRLIEESRSA